MSTPVTAPAYPRIQAKPLGKVDCEEADTVEGAITGIDVDEVAVEGAGESASVDEIADDPAGNLAGVVAPEDAKEVEGAFVCVVEGAGEGEGECAIKNAAESSLNGDGGRR